MFNSHAWQIPYCAINNQHIQKLHYRYGNDILEIMCHYILFQPNSTQAYFSDVELKNEGRKQKIHAKTT